MTDASRTLCNDLRDAVRELKECLLTEGANRPDFDCNGRVCGNCRFSRTTEVFDPVAASFDHFKSFSKGKVTRCHIQGAPRRVDPVVDWCYKWEAKRQ